MTLLMDVNKEFHIYEGTEEAELITSTCAGDAVGVIVASSMLSEEANVLALVNIADELPADFMTAHKPSYAVSYIFDKVGGVANAFDMCMRLMERARAKCGKEPFDKLAE